MDSVPPKTERSVRAKAQADESLADASLLATCRLAVPIAVVDAVNHRDAGYVVFGIRISAASSDWLATDHGRQRLRSDVDAEVAPGWKRRSANAAPDVVVLIEPDSALRDYRGASSATTWITSRRARIGSLSDVWNLVAENAL